MSRPSFQFYPSDWTGNSNLRRCSHAEKGVWMDILCLMHDQDEYGVLRWSLKEIIAAVGCSVSLVSALVSKGVMRGCSAGQECDPFIYTPRSGRKDGPPVTLIPAQAGPIWYSSRMVKDEHIRRTAGASSRFGSPTNDGTKPQLETPPKVSPGRAPSRRLGDDQGDGSSSSSSSPSSVTNVTGQMALLPEPEMAPPDPLKMFFDTGTAVLGELGCDPKKVRSILGKLRQSRGNRVDECQRVIDELAEIRPAEPISWLMARSKTWSGYAGAPQESADTIY